MYGPTVSALKEARRAYVAAVRAMDAALRRFDDSDIPMNPGTGPEPYPWSAEHVRIVLELHSAIGQVIQARRSWDRRNQVVNASPLFLSSSSSFSAGVFHPSVSRGRPLSLSAISSKSS